MRIEFDLTDERVTLAKPADDAMIQKAEGDLGVQLPPTYKKWLKEYGNGGFFDRGNALQLFPLHHTDEKQVSVLSQTGYFRSIEYCQLKDLVVFGCSGVDGETWAFYTGNQSGNGEYPIIWISPYSVHEEGFVLFSTNFESFLNIYVQFLRYTDENDVTDQGEDEHLLSLFFKYEQTLRLATSNLYQIAVTADKIVQLAKQL